MKNYIILMIILYVLIIDCKRHHKNKVRRIEFNNNKNKEYKKNRYLKKKRLMVDRIDYLYEDEFTPLRWIDYRIGSDQHQGY